MSKIQQYGRRIFGRNVVVTYTSHVPFHKISFGGWTNEVGKDTFDTSKVLQKDGKHLKIVRDQYRVHLEENPRYERPPMIPSGEWKALVEYGKEKILRKAGKIPPRTWRYVIHSTM